jgi:TRAP-type transport system periplasmic protein
VKLLRKSFLAIGALGAPIGYLAPSRAQSTETYTLRLNLTAPITSAQGACASRFAAAVDRRSKGQLKIEIYPNGQLARERGILEGLTSGAIDLEIGTIAVLEALFPRFQILSLPFLFKNAAAAFRVLDGPIGAEFFADAEAKGLVGLGWADTGFRELETTSKPVVVPDDMKGLRIRIQNGAVYVTIFQALGAIPVTIDLSETFTAVTQHTVDAVDVPIDGFIDQKFYTIMKHVAMLNHVFSVNAFMGSKRKVDALPLNLQRIIKEEGKAAMPFWRALSVRQTADNIGMLKKSGVLFTEIQYPLFRKAMDPVYASLQSKIGGDLIDRIGRAANAAAGI